MEKNKGFTLVEIMIVVAIIGVLAMIAIPNFIISRQNAYRSTCVANLRQIANAKQLWAMSIAGTSVGTPVWADLVPTHMRNIPACPAGGTYTIGPMVNLPRCSVANHVL